MPSPFPGMDPYIESCGLWEDFHDSLISEIKGTLARRVPDRYVVRSGERAYVVLTVPEDANGKTEHMTQSDVSVTSGPGYEQAQESPGTVAVAEVVEAGAPVTMRALIEAEFRESFIEIREASGDRKLVTTIEILSPSNKKSGTAGWERFLRKRQAHLEGAIANLVEIDLLRGGTRMPMLDSWPASPYYFLVARREQTPECKVWPAHFKLPLPEIPIPLEPHDADVPLALQPIVLSIYKSSRYEKDVDYHQHCHPSLSSGDREWLAERL